MERASSQKIELLEGAVTLELLVNDRSGYVAYVVWPSTFHVAAFLSVLALGQPSLASALKNSQAMEQASQRLQSQDAKTRRQLFAEARRRMVLQGVDVLELGAGTGALGLGLHSLGARVMMTDQSKCLELLAANVRQYKESKNSEASSCEASSCETSLMLTCAPLDWKDWSKSELRSTDFFSVSATATAASTCANESPVLSAASSSSNCQLLIACDCVYDTSHIGRSPLVPIIKDFVAASTARGGDNGTGRREPFAERFAILALETRDKEIESDFEFQLNEAGLRSVLAHEAPCPQPSEGNETPPEEARYRIFVITEGTLEPPAATEVDE